MKTVKWVIKWSWKGYPDCMASDERMTEKSAVSLARHIRSCGGTKITVHRIETTTTEEKVEWEKGGE